MIKLVVFALKKDNYLIVIMKNDLNFLI